MAEAETASLHVLAFGAHPDDVELSCGGTLLAEAAKGYRTGIVDLTRGELGTRGTAEDRDKEANDAAAILGLSSRENLRLADGFFRVDRASLEAVVRAIRQHRPTVVLANAQHDRHPDHGRGGDLVQEACFLAGLRQMETSLNGVSQEAFRPKALYRYIQDRWIKPDLVVDISGFIDPKMEAIKAYRTQFFDPASTEPQTYISTSAFMDGLLSRSREMGRMAGYEYGEGYTSVVVPGYQSLCAGIVGLPG